MSIRMKREACVKTCRNCGATNSADDRFCANCGAALPEQEDQQPRPQGEQTSPAQSDVKGTDPYGQPGYGTPQPPIGAYGQQPPANDPHDSQTGGQYAQPPQGQYGQPGGNPHGQPPQDQYGQYGQPGGNPYGQQPNYGQPPGYGQPQYDQQGQPYGSQPQGQYGQPPGDPYADQTPQPWYATGSGSGASPPPVRRRGRSRWKTAILIIVGLILLVCIGSIIFAVTPYGSDQVERLGTWAAEESTRQAGGE